MWQLFTQPQCFIWQYILHCFEKTGTWYSNPHVSQPFLLHFLPTCMNHSYINTLYNTHTRPCLTALCPELLGSASTRKVKPIWILLKQETVSGSDNSWAICKSAPRSRQITTPASHHPVFYRPDALPATQPTASKHWRHINMLYKVIIYKKITSTSLSGMTSTVTKRKLLFESNFSLVSSVAAVGQITGKLTARGQWDPTSPLITGEICHLEQPWSSSINLNLPFHSRKQ